MEASKDWRGAIRALDEWLRGTDPRDVEVLLSKGYILDSVHRFAAGFRIYREVLRIAPNNPPALIQVGSYYANIRRDDRKALRYFRRALRLVEAGQAFEDEEDEFVDACTENAGALLRLKRPLAALRIIVKGLQKHPGNIVLGGVLQRAQEQYRAAQEKRLGKHYFKVKKQLGIE